MKRVVMLLASLCLFAGCGNDVDWSRYAPDLHGRIDGLARSKDCAALQEQFDNADRSNSADLMGYIDEAMRKAGCY